MSENEKAPDQSGTPQVKYNEDTALRAHSVFCHMAQALKQLDVLETKRVINSLTTPKSEEQAQRLARLNEFYDNLHAFRETMKKTGAPRPQEHFQQRAGAGSGKRATG